MHSTDYKGKNVLITGGLGFIGSNLAIRLVERGANVLLMDAMLPGYGGNLFNIAPVKADVAINYADIRDEHVMNYLVRDRDYIFHLAAQVSHVKSLSDPYPDIDINIRGTAILLEACKKHNRDAVVVRTGTRGQYGKVCAVPVDEETPMNPRGIYEISQLSAEQITKVYNDIHGVRCVMLRLTNIYGPRAQMLSPDFGVVNWFVRQAVDHKPIQVFGDGKIKRDFLYVDDCVDVILLAASQEKCFGDIFNVGNDVPSDFLELAEQLASLEKGASWEFAPFTPERAAQEPGDFCSNITKIKSYTGWRPEISLEEGLRRTLDYYRQNRRHYWND
jgi:UDP-glucose 4-epimerase